ncbi:MAG: 1-acyl-sn-glycerol-3-phosphate acyltransferase [Clostridiales bacterium]|jgi:1-acyl-sn-glycerol-3-phosphate acyltransferase|nr:1-acyl-sn-glycerol-3-phosphate acyltransferase [Clostridiales bacterium]
MKYIVTAIAKITGALALLIFYRPKVFYINKQKQSRRIKGGAVLVSNHTSLSDFPLMLLIFPFRFVRYLMAEVLFKTNGLLNWFLTNIGGIYVNRDTRDMSFMTESLKILAKGGVVGSFPEARLVASGELLPFTLSTVSIALKSGVPIIPVYLTRRAKRFQKAYVMIGEPIHIGDYCDTVDPGIERLKELSELLRDSIIGLRTELRVRIHNEQA